MNLIFLIFLMNLIFSVIDVIFVCLGRPKIAVNEAGMFQTCINLLSAMLADNREIGGKQHIERLYLFCLIWAYGGLLEGLDRKNFNTLIKTLSSA